MRFSIAFECTFMIIREIWKKNFFFETAKKIVRGDPYDFFLQFKKKIFFFPNFPYSHKCTPKSYIKMLLKKIFF